MIIIKIQDRHLNLLFFFARIPKSSPRRRATATCLLSPFPAMMSCLLLICSTISFSEKPSCGCSDLSNSYTRIDLRTILINLPGFLNESISRRIRHGNRVLNVLVNTNRKLAVIRSILSKYLHLYSHGLQFFVSQLIFYWFLY